MVQLRFVCSQTIRKNGQPEGVATVSSYNAWAYKHRLAQNEALVKRYRPNEMETFPARFV